MNNRTPLSAPELAAVLAGLRLLQWFRKDPRQCIVLDATGTPSYAAMEAIDDIVDDHPVDDVTIDTLCDLLNRGDES